jgi:hypothetical protein
MMHRRREGKPVKWSLSTQVMAQLIDADLSFKQIWVARRVMRSVALAKERAEIARLVRRGVVLSNVQHNPNRHISATAIAKIVINAQPSS